MHTQSFGATPSYPKHTSGAEATSFYHIQTYFIFQGLTYLQKKLIGPKKWEVLQNLGVAGIPVPSRYSNTVKLGNKELFGHRKIVP